MGMEQSAWLAGMIKQQMWLIDLQQQQLQQQQMWERDDTQQSHIFVSNSGSTASLFDSANPTSGKSVKKRIDIILLLIGFE